MNNKIIIINGPNINLLGEREQSQYGSITLSKIIENCQKKSSELNTTLIKTVAGHFILCITISAALLI